MTADSSKKLNAQERMLRTIKWHKKKALKHTFIAFCVTLVLLVSFNQIDHMTEAEVSVAQGSETLTLTLMGDIMMGRNIAKVGKYHGYETLFRHVQPFFQQSDYITANFENPVVLNEGYPLADKYIHLKTDYEVAKEMQRQGFDVLNLANNHTLDFSEAGLYDTLQTFDQLGIKTVGSGTDLEDSKRIVYEEVNGYTIATMGFSDVRPKGFISSENRPGILEAKPEYYMPMVQEAAEHADIVVVHMHWGEEYDTGVQPRQREIGQILVDVGADIVVGHHPHVLEPVEFYKDGVILYSLGNFIFDQGWSRTRESALVQYKLFADGSAKVEVTPVYIRNGEPRPVQGWSSFYRKFKIYSAVSDSMAYTNKWRETWEVEGDRITHTIRRTFSE